jgi:F0F1-type ATP synthase epsilon subunit
MVLEITWGPPKSREERKREAMRDLNAAWDKLEKIRKEERLLEALDKNKQRSK